MPRSDTPAGEKGERRKEKGESPEQDTDKTQALIRAAAEAVEELRAARELILKQQIQIAVQERVIEADAAIIGKFRELRALDAEEKSALRGAIDAKSRQIAAMDEEVRLLKRQRGGFWKTVKTVIVSAAAGIVLGNLVND